MPSPSTESTVSPARRSDSIRRCPTSSFRSRSASSRTDAASSYAAGATARPPRRPIGRSNRGRVPVELLDTPDPAPASAAVGPSAGRRAATTPDEPSLEDRGGQRSRAHPVVDGVELTEQPPGPPPVPGEVGPDLLADVGGLAHIEHVAGGIGEPVHAGAMGETGREEELARLRMADQPGEVEQLPECQDPVRTGPLEHGMEEVGGGQDVGQGPVGRPVGEPEVRGQGAELAVGHHVAHQTSGQGQGVHGGVGQALASGRGQGVVDEREVEAQVVPDEHGPADELEERGEHLPGAWGVGHHGIADAGERGDERGYAPIGPDQGLVGADQLAAPVPGGGDLGERRRGRRAAGGLDVDDHEGHLAERGAQIVEGSFADPRRAEVGHHGDTVANTCSIEVDPASRARPTTVWAVTAESPSRAPARPPRPVPTPEPPPPGAWGTRQLVSPAPATGARRAATSPASTW